MAILPFISSLGNTRAVLNIKRNQQQERKKLVLGDILVARVTDAISRDEKYRIFLDLAEDSLKREQISPADIEKLLEMFDEKVPSANLVAILDALIATSNAEQADFIWSKVNQALANTSQPEVIHTSRLLHPAGATNLKG